MTKYYKPINVYKPRFNTLFAKASKSSIRFYYT